MENQTKETIGKILTNYLEITLTMTMPLAPFGQKQTAKLDHPPHSPDLAPSDFWLFPKNFDSLMFLISKGTYVAKILKNTPEGEFQERSLTRCTAIHGDGSYQFVNI